MMLTAPSREISFGCNEEELTGSEKVRKIMPSIKSKLNEFKIGDIVSETKFNTGYPGNPSTT